MFRGWIMCADEGPKLRYGAFLDVALGSYGCFCRADNIRKGFGRHVDVRRNKECGGDVIAFGSSYCSDDSENETVLGMRYKIEQLRSVHRVGHSADSGTEIMDMTAHGLVAVYVRQVLMSSLRFGNV